MTGSASLDDSPNISSDNASNNEEESEYSNSDKTDDEEYDDQPRQLSWAQAPKKRACEQGVVDNRK